MAKRKASSPEPLSPVGQRIQALLDARKLGDNAFAGSLGWTGGYFSKFKRQEDPSGLRVLAVARALDVDFLYLLTGERSGGGARDGFVATLAAPDERALKAIMAMTPPNPDTSLEWWAERYAQARKVYPLVDAQEETLRRGTVQEAPRKPGQRKSEPRG